MTRSLFFLRDQGLGSGHYFGIKPYSEKRWPEYMALQRRINLKDDLRWKEVKDLRNILEKADAWEDFPARGLCLVVAEEKVGDEDQYIDLLYLRDDGALLPCELKRGGDSLDTHGQLIRYISDLTFQSPNLEWLQKYNQKQASSFKDPVARSVHEERFAKFNEKHQISDKFIRVLPRSGIIIDEGFKPQILKTIRYLNDECGFSIRLIQMEAYVDSAWNINLAEYFMRIDFVDVR